MPPAVDPTAQTDSPIRPWRSAQASDVEAGSGADLLAYQADVVQRLRNLQRAAVAVDQSTTVQGRWQEMLRSVASLETVAAAVLLPSTGEDTLWAGESVAVAWLKSQQGRNPADPRRVVVPLIAGLQTIAELHVLSATGVAVDPLDVATLEALAAITTVGVAKTGQHASTVETHAWLDAAAEITSTLLSTFADETEVWSRVVAASVRLSIARTATLCLPEPEHPDQMRVVVAAGVGAEELTGTAYPAEGSLAERVMHSGRGQLVDPASVFCVHSRVEPDNHLAQSMGVPLQSARGVRGALVLSRGSGQDPFTMVDMKLAAEFADQAVLALELAELRAAEQRVQIAEDRERIAADLHDHVVQQLFATGLRLQSSAHATNDRRLRSRLLQCGDAIDETMKQIRSTIFELKFIPDASASLQAGAVALVTELEPVLGLRPRITFHGPVEDLQQFPELVNDIRAVLREALTNVAKHAHATRVEVTLTYQPMPGRVAVWVWDDGVGLGTATRSSGRGNMAQRAARWGGNLVMTSPDHGGTELTWTIPMLAVEQ